MSGLVNIQNISCTCNVGTKLDLQYLARNLANIEYSKKFTAAIMRIKAPKTTCLIFDSGNLVITGGKSFEESKKAARRFSRAIQKIEPEAQFNNFKISNVVGSFELPFIPNFIELVQDPHMQKHIFFEPTLFPALYFRQDKEDKQVAIIFRNGKVILTGAKTEIETYIFADNVYDVLVKYKRHNP